MKKRAPGSKAKVPKKTARKMLIMPFCAYCVQMRPPLLLSSTEALVTPVSSLMLALMNSTAR